jgi:hypothetical protein
MSATIILQFLGGSTFQTTKSARDFSYPHNGLAFRLARPTSEINRVTILPGDHGFTMMFFRGDSQIASVAGVHAERLRATFDEYIR